MNSNPAANDPIVRIMRDTCARFTDSAEKAGVLAPLLLLLAEALARLFGRIEDIFLLWRAGELPPPPVQPLRAPRPHVRRARNPGKRRIHARRRVPVLRARRPRAPLPVTSERSHPRPSAPTRRIDRYPKPFKNAAIQAREPAFI